MRVSSKGQVTIPKRVRDAIGVQPGGEVEFDVNGNIATMRRATKRGGRKSRGERMIEALRGTATLNRELSTDEIMKLLRGDD